METKDYFSSCIDVVDTAQAEPCFAATGARGGGSGPINCRRVQVARLFDGGKVGGDVPRYQLLDADNGMFGDAAQNLTQNTWWRSEGTFPDLLRPAIAIVQSKKQRQELTKGFDGARFSTFC